MFRVGDRVMINDPRSFSYRDYGKITHIEEDGTIHVQMENVARYGSGVSYFDADQLVFA